MCSVSRSNVIIFRLKCETIKSFGDNFHVMKCCTAAAAAAGASAAAGGGVQALINTQHITGLLYSS